MATEKNLNGTTPAATSGFQLGQWQVSGSPTGTDPTTGQPVYAGSVQVPNTGGVSVKTISYTAVAADCGLILSFNSSGAVTLTLPAAPPFAQWSIGIQNIGAGVLTVNRNGLNIDGVATNLTLAQGSGVTIATDATNYFTERGFSSTTGTVTSVGLAAPSSILTVSGSPITSAGTLTLTLATQSANTVFRGPTSGSPATPTFGSIVAADLPLATTGAFGAVKPDGTTIAISGGVISATGGVSIPFVLSIPTSDTVGEIIQGSSTVPGAQIQGNNYQFNAGTSFTATLSNIQVGNTIILNFFSGSTAITGVTDSLGNTYTRLTITADTLMSVYSAPIQAGGNVTITVTTSVSANVYYEIYEWSNVSNVLDVSALGTSTSNPSVVGPVTTTQANDLLISFIYGVSSSATPTASGFTPLLHYQVGPPGRMYTSGWQLAATAGSYSASWSGATYTGTVDTILIALKSNGQTVDLAQFKSGSGTVLSTINSAGQFVLPSTAGAPTNTPTPGAKAYDSTNGIEYLRTAAGWVPVGPITLTTAGSSGPATLTGRTLNVPNYVAGGGGGEGFGPPLVPTNPPAISSFTWVNQGGATATNPSGSSAITLVAPTSTTSFRMLMITAPSTPYSIDAYFLFTLFPNVNFQLGGLAFRDTGSGKIVNFYLIVGPGFPGWIGIDQNSSVTTPVANLYRVAWGLASISGFFMRVTDDGTNRKYAVSFDGVAFAQVYSEARTTYMTANQVGFFVSDDSNTNPASLTLTSWLQH